MSTATITTWLLTYLAHSTILLGAAWLAARFMGDRRLALQEVLLRTALVGGLLTATLQVGLGVEPVGGSLAITDLSLVEAAAPIENITASITTGDTTFSPISAGHRQPLGVWPIALLSLWGIGSILALSVLGRSIVDLRRLLETRRFRPAGRLLERLSAAMGIRRTVRLSTTAAIAVPFATGIRKPEICCPERVSGLAFDHQKSLFAHELAHLARRDPAWQLFYRIGEAFFFLQPLNRIVRRRLEEIAEHLTDERAVACTGDRLGLARCLVVVAHWGISDAPGIPATALASGPRLDQRVRHLISGAVGQHRIARWTAPLLVVLVVGSVLLLPAVAPSTVHADVSRTGPDAVAAQTWSTPADNSDAMTSAPSAAPAVPTSSDVFVPSPPVTDVVPLSPTEPRPVSAPAPAVEPEPPTEPDPKVEPEPPSPPAAPAPPPEAEREARERQRALAGQAMELAREAAERSRLTDAEREKLRDEARARSRLASERSRLTEDEREEMRRRLEELYTEVRALAREAAERPRLTDAERQKLWDATRELRRRAEAEALEHSRLAAERMRFTQAEREEIWRRVEELHAQSRAQARELAEQARRLAEEAEAERQREEERRQRNRNED
jgi:beta-lactamase regulating signal transducer with metallopeptidase domain